MRFRIRVLFVSLATVAGVACNSPSELRPPQLARIRIVNAAPGTTGIQVFRDAFTTAVATLSFRASTGTCVTFPEGDHVFHFRSGTTTLASTPSQSFAGNASYTAVLTAAGATNKAIVLADDFAPQTDFNGLRFVNAMETPGDVYVLAPGGAIGTPIVTDLPNPEQTTTLPVYYSSAAANTQVLLFDPDVNTGTPRADFTFNTLTGRRLGTAVLTDAGTPTGFLVTACP